MTQQTEQQVTPVNEGFSNAINGAVVDYIAGKKWYLSRTFWANVILGGAIIVQSQYGFVVGPELQALLIAAVNLGLRKLTNEPIIW